MTKLVKNGSEIVVEGWHIDVNVAQVESDPLEFICVPPDITPRSISPIKADSNVGFAACYLLEGDVGMMLPSLAGCRSFLCLLFLDAVPNCFSFLLRIARDILEELNRDFLTTGICKNVVEY